MISPPLSEICVYIEGWLFKTVVLKNKRRHFIGERCADFLGDRVYLLWVNGVENSAFNVIYLHSFNFPHLLPAN